MPPLETNESRECSRFWFLRKAIRSGSMPQILEALRIKSKKRTKVIEGTKTPEGMNLYDWRDFKVNHNDNTREISEPNQYFESDLKIVSPEDLIIANMWGLCFVGRKIFNEEWGWKFIVKTDSWNITTAWVNTFDGIEAKDIYEQIMEKNWHYEVWDNVFAHYGKKIEPYEKAVVLARIVWIENNNYVLMIKKNKTITLPKSEVEETTRQECKKLYNWNWGLDDSIEFIWWEPEIGDSLVFNMDNNFKSPEE